MNQRSTIIHSDMRAGLLDLTKEQCGDLFLSLLNLAEGVEREPDANELRVLWKIMRAKQIELWDRFEQTSKNRAKAGRKGGTAKAINCYSGKTRNSKASKCQHLPAKLAIAPQSNPIQSNPIQSNTPHTPPSGDGGFLDLDVQREYKMSEMFEEWWKIYPRCPRKSDKNKCASKFTRIVKDGVTAETLVSALKMRLQRDSNWAKNDGEFVEAPLVYLNQKRWEAYADASQSASADGRRQDDGGRVDARRMGETGGELC